MEDEQKFKNKYRTTSHRLKNYDYSFPGGYFLTICTHNKECIFGEIINGEMTLNDLGRIAHDEWLNTGKIRDNVIVDEFIVMPNHVHGILIVNDGGPEKSTKCNPVETNCNLSLQKTQKIPKQHGTSQTIGSIIRGFKIGVTKYSRQKTNMFTKIWQPNYYDHIIRNENELNRIREYIIQNPAKWTDDRNNIENM